MNKEIKAVKRLSIRQPWAWLIVNGHKDIENRDWPTRFRGRILIHAGKTMTRADYDACKLFLAASDINLQLPEYHDLLRGGIVGEAEIVDCVSASDSPWFVGRFGFVMANAKPLPFVGCPGQLGLY